MPDFSQSGFPTLQSIMDLARATVNDMYPGLAGQNGRVLTNDALFTLTYLNEAFDTLQRKLRIEGVKFPIKVAILAGIVPIAQPDASIMPYIGFNGYFDGNQQHPTPALPGDLMQPYYCWEQTAGSNLPFTPMAQPQQGIPSSLQGQNLSVWEWRNYGIYLTGCLQSKNMKVRYRSGQPPIAATPTNFSTTKVNILDSRSALGLMVAEQYASARGADTTKLDGKIAGAIDDMAAEYVRQSQSQPVRRQPYGGVDDQDGMLGQTAVRD